MQKLNKFLLGIVFFTLHFGITFSIYAQPEKQVERVLFIGNSYTYYNSLPQLLKALAEQINPNLQVEVKFIGGGGASFEKHWEVGEALDEIRTGKWNYVVLQEQSTFGAVFGSGDLSDSDIATQFYKYSRKFVNEINLNDSQAVFFMIWSKKGQEDYQKYIIEYYSTIANELESKLAPVGKAWEMLRKITNINLYNYDGSHPSIAGSYLSALCLYKTIFNDLPEEIPGKLFGREILYGGELSKDRRQLCNFNPAQVQVMRSVIEPQTAEFIKSE